MPGLVFEPWFLTSMLPIQVQDLGHNLTVWSPFLSVGSQCSPFIILQMKPDLAGPDKDFSFQVETEGEVGEGLQCDI